MKAEEKAGELKSRKSRKSRRAGEQESRRAGEQESGRAGERESRKSGIPEVLEVTVKPETVKPERYWLDYSYREKKIYIVVYLKPGNLPIGVRDT